MLALLQKLTKNVNDTSQINLIYVMQLLDFKITYLYLTWKFWIPIVDDKNKFTYIFRIL